ncbi:hypothetical protein [uncultured Planktomarina sp.]|uniref:nuclear transport factor 2 family protein n=1 Tax=uncultured Planktomarina sp. TaxID=1538529 RepID=UPI0032610235
MILQKVLNHVHCLTQSEGIYNGAATAFCNLWRVENGKIAEHWDVVQTVPEEFARDNGMF